MPAIHTTYIHKVKLLSTNTSKEITGLAIDLSRPHTLCNMLPGGSDFLLIIYGYRLDTCMSLTKT